MSDLVPKVFTNLSDNPYFGAGFGLVGVGALLAATKQATALGVTLLKRHYLMTLEITHRDQAYPWVLNWLTHHHKNAQHLGVVTQLNKKNGGNFQSRFEFVPCVGTHFVQFNKKWMKVERERNQTVVDPFETIKFTCLGNDKSIFSDMLRYANELELSKHEGRTVIYEARTNGWEPFGEPRRRRDYASVILDQNKSENIFHDINEFLDSRDWYHERGIPYRRGYLLHGPPGCGKTSFITALAGKLEYDICQINLSDSAMADDRLSHFLNIAPPNSIILLEDVDAAFVNRDDIDYSTTTYHGLRKLTLSGILNVIDGVASTEERILFMTTNYPERLDKALTRPGRVDMSIYFGYATDEQLSKAFLKFYPDSDPKCFTDSLAGVCKRLKLSRNKLNLSMAEVQSYFLLHKNNQSKAVEDVEAWLKERNLQVRKQC